MFVFKVSKIVLVSIFILFLVFTSIYTVGETEEAVVTTFGKVTSVNSAGLNFKLPAPVQRVQKVPVHQTQRMEIGYRPDTEEYILAESKMITGDFNIVNIDFFIEWKISDPEKFLYSSKTPTTILRNVAQASARNVVGSKSVDDVLTVGKDIIQMEIRETIVEKLAQYDLGIHIQDVKIQDSEPPVHDVIEAFKAVETAKQQRESFINDAMAYKNSELPEAQSKADKLVRTAESYRESRINQAKGEVAKFNSMFAEYEQNPEVTRTRMYLETIERVLPGVPVYIDTGDGSVQKLLPLRDFAQGQ